MAMLIVRHDDDNVWIIDFDDGQNGSIKKLEGDEKDAMIESLEETDENGYPVAPAFDNLMNAVYGDDIVEKDSTGLHDKHKH